MRHWKSPTTEQPVSLHVILPGCDMFLEDLCDAEITIYWFMYGELPKQKMHNDNHEYSLSRPYDLTTVTYIGKII